MQAEVNIGLLGHVDHGKTTLTKALTGKWTDTHSEEIKRGISIRLGYADATTYFCEPCKKYSFSEKCSSCGKKGQIKRKISFLDAPGHETLMTTAISASSVIDGALFLIAANEPCPQPQTAEHLMILNTLGIKNIIVVQTKIDLVTKERALESYKEIKNFLSKSVAENAPIVPVSANFNLNIDAIVEEIEHIIPTPKRDKTAPLRMFVSRSFDVNKPGTSIDSLNGGVIGGSIIQGSIKIGDEVELKPGIIRKEGGKPEKLTFKVANLREESEKLEEGFPGGLIAVGTKLDPSLTKSDALIGGVLGRIGELPEPFNVVKIKYELLKRTDVENPPLKQNEAVVVNVNTTTNVGVIVELAKGIATIRLKKLMIADKSSKAAISRKIDQRWRLAAWGQIV
ncbi:translation initiation factor IF-2 subunit gamma [Candidatus Micrarchaeota archaeon]|nr:translation initiation factor IF-2 subunit gamma [Candidatus Micrarchaeota archaeon]